MSRLHHPKAGFWIRFCVALLYPLDAVLFKIRWRGLEKIPAEGGVILVVNHISYIDTILMARLVWQSGRIPRFLIKSGVFAKPVIGRVMSGAGQIPVYRGTADAQKSLLASVDALCHPRLERPWSGSETESKRRAARARWPPGVRG